MVECLEYGRALCLQGCAYPLHWSDRERKRERGRKWGERVCEKVGTERFLKGMMGVLAPFIYLVLQEYNFVALKWSSLHENVAPQDKGNSSNVS